MTAIRIPTNLRWAVRAALRNHPRCAEILANMGVEYVNNLGNRDLLIACGSAGIDVQTVMADAAASPTMAKPTPRPAPGEGQGAEDEGQGDEDEGEDAEDEDEGQGQGQGEGQGEGQGDEAAPLTDADTLEADAAELRRDIFNRWSDGDFVGTMGVLRDLLAEARKPAVVVHVPVSAPGAPGTVPAHVPSPQGALTWADAFGVADPDFAGRKIRLWDAQDTIPVDPDFVFREDVTIPALTTLARHRNPWLFGPPGTGKTSWAEQMAARLRRPYRLISCDDTTEAPELMGMLAPHEGGVRWLDGMLVSAVRIPGCVICIDEPTVAREGAIMMLQSLLQQRYIYIRETGESVDCAPGVCFIACDNTNGTGGGASQGFMGTRALNTAFLDRFAATIHVPYLPAAEEAGLLVRRTGCSRALADMLVNIAGVSRAHSASGTLTQAVGFRRLMAWAEALLDGNPARRAFEICVLNKAPADDHETLNQLAVLALDPAAIATALKG